MGNPPNVKTVLCGHCDVEAERGQFGSLECPECGRCIEVRAAYAGRDEDARQEAIQRHAGDS